MRLPLSTASAGHHGPLMTWLLSSFVGLWAGALLAQTPHEVELLRDPGFAHGITQGYANHLPPPERADCLRRWQDRGLSNAQWAFWEISESLHFAHNPETPTVFKPGHYAWSTENGAKQCLVQDGSVHLIFDTNQEWRAGGSLNLPDASGKAPRYGDPHTTWPHFLIGQHFARNNDPTAPIPEEEKLQFDKFRTLRFTAEIKLNHLRKSSPLDYRAEYGAANHAIFYVAFIAMPRQTSRLAEMGKFYVLVPAIYSEGEERHVPGSAPWLGLDQFGDGVYFSGAQPALQPGKWVDYDVDVKQLVREAFSAATQKMLSSGNPRRYALEDYYLAALLIGWEVWGGFDTDVEFKKLSLSGMH